MPPGRKPPPAWPCRCCARPWAAAFRSLVAWWMAWASSPLIACLVRSMAESTADFLFRHLRDEIPKTMRGKLGGMLIRPGVRQLRARVDWREFGGAPLLGIDGVAVVAHGRSDARAIKNAVRVTRDAVQNQLVGKIRAEVGK